MKTRASRRPRRGPAAHILRAAVVSRGGKRNEERDRVVSTPLARRKGILGPMYSLGRRSRRGDSTLFQARQLQQYASLRRRIYVCAGVAVPSLVVFISWRKYGAID